MGKGRNLEPQPTLSLLKADIGPWKFWEAQEIQLATPCQSSTGRVTQVVIDTERFCLFGHTCEIWKLNFTGKKAQ